MLRFEEQEIFILRALLVFFAAAAMPIYYALLARRRVVLCDYADVSGNFESLSQAVLERLPATDTKISYESGTYLFHCVVSQGLSFICVTEATFDRNVAYAYLFELQRQLASARLEQRAAIAGPYALRRDFSGVVESLMHRYSSSDHLTSLQTQVSAGEHTSRAISRNTV